MPPGRDAGLRRGLDHDAGLVTVTGQSAGARKLRRGMYWQAIDTLALSAGRVLFVAGSPYDIPGAGRIGMDVVA